MVLFCLVGYYFVVWLMLAEYTCTTTYLDSESPEYQDVAEDVTYVVRACEMMGRARKFGKYKEDAGLDLKCM